MITLTNVGTAYDTIQAARGLGIALIDFRGATQVRFVVYHQKIGTGTISYQLWNETDGAEICVLTDASGQAVRLLDQTFAGIAINGIKLCRIRAKSTVSTDDPIFFGAAVQPLV